MPRRTAGQLYRVYENEQEWTVVDVRTLASFEQVHIPGAAHLPLEELEERIGELDGNKTIVFYCLSPNDAMSLQAAMLAYAAGFSQIAILSGGIQEWYSDGYPIEGTLLTPTPRAGGPPWTVTPLSTTGVSTQTVTVTPATVQPTATRVPTEAPTATPTS